MPVHCPRCGTVSTLAPGAAAFCATCGSPIAVPAAPMEASPQRTSKLAVASLVAGLMFCLPVLNMIVGVALGIAALVSINGRPRELRGQGLAIAGIVLSVGSLFFSGILAAIAIPNFIRYTERAKDTEARANLKALGEAERAYFAEHRAFVAFGPVPTTVGAGPSVVPEAELPPELGFRFAGPVRFQYSGDLEGAGLVLRARRQGRTGPVTFTESVTESGVGPVEGGR